MSDKLLVTLDGKTAEVPMQIKGQSRWLHAKTVHTLAGGTNVNEVDAFLRTDNVKSLLIETALMKGNFVPAYGRDKSEDENITSQGCNKSEGSVATCKSEDENIPSTSRDKSEDENIPFYKGNKNLTVFPTLSLSDDAPLKLETLILKDKKGSEYNVADLTQRSEYLTATNKERLPAELETSLVHTPSRKQGAYFREDLFIKYAAYLSSELEVRCLSALATLVRISELPADKQADVHIDKAVEILRKDTKPHQTPEKRLDTKTKTKYLSTVLDSMIPAGEVKNDWYMLMHSETNRLFEHTASEMKQLVDSSKSPRENMSDRCLHVVEAVEALVVDELLGMRSAKVQLTKELLISISKEAVALVKPRLFKWVTEVDFLANENKKTKVLTEVTLKSDYSTSKQVTNLKQLT